MELLRKEEQKVFSRLAQWEAREYVLFMFGSKNREGGEAIRNHCEFELHLKIILIFIYIYLYESAEYQFC